MDKHFENVGSRRRRSSTGRSALDSIESVGLVTPAATWGQQLYPYLP